MDIWDALRLMARRWQVSVPLTILTLAAAAWTLVTVEPHHTSSGHIMLLPPSIEIVAGEDTTDQAVNPWSTEALMAAVVTRLNNRALADQLEEEGYNATWEASADVQFSAVVVIETTSSDPGSAQAALQRLMNLVDAEVEQQQQPYQVPPAAKITTLHLDGGENLELARGNQARALVVVFGIGGILTLVVTVSTDVLIRRRANRRGSSAPPALRIPAMANGGAAATPSAGNGSAPHVVSSPPAWPDNGESQPGITVKYRPQSPHSGHSEQSEPSESSEPSEPSARPGPRPPFDPEDSTIVLPLARTSWEPRKASEEPDEAADNDRPTR